ncbi:related to CBP3-required for assembly of cytochrome bc1 complex [Rhynchosporium secalis]|uniref:Related to CBP3-required for assembly of cytochrome bc1 complex n=1 Tax=Rhynchosporium secalis TaxID=38038 RepID=A0A1E1MHI9_RHYSE|nr:related to CBP3-required for assembly of cytochrome bc1 complex [Rhynchosporium secalis]
MVSKSCLMCLRTMRQAQPSRIAASAQRAFTSSSHRYVEPLPPNAPQQSSIPPVTPLSGGGGSKINKAPLPVSMKAAAGLQKVTGKATETYTAYGATEAMYKECARQADYSITLDPESEEEMPKTEDGEDLGIGGGWWLTEAGLKPTFSTWSQVTMLHLYLLSVRLRCFPAQSEKPWQQHLLDHFFHDAENRMMIYHNMHASGTRSKYLKDLFIQWRGLLAAYDEGLVKGDAVLAAAIWRNVFKASEDVDINALGQVVSYMRKVLKKLDALPDERIGQAAAEFGSPKGESAVVRQRSKMLDLPFEKASGKDLPGGKQA